MAQTLRNRLVFGKSVADDVYSMTFEIRVYIDRYGIERGRLQWRLEVGFLQQSAAPRQRGIRHCSEIRTGDFVGLSSGVKVKDTRHFHMLYWAEMIVREGSHRAIAPFVAIKAKTQNTFKDSVTAAAANVSTSAASGEEIKITMNDNFIDIFSMYDATIFMTHTGGIIKSVFEPDNA
ncbi:hypothetical protein F2P81_007200 [Scophthalmus maximus]|uniref:Uncharacterized protein n=1 Tax=Scophthalmus maximus TaxID=52904 RepID=A0A6A4TGQ8_SCOMX|nr:hypothetical protein F2P81_007200 [Scophthalmus maximus]